MTSTMLSPSSCPNEGHLSNCIVHNKRWCITGTFYWHKWQQLTVSSASLTSMSGASSTHIDSGVLVVTSFTHRYSTTALLKPRKATPMWRAECDIKFPVASYNPHQNKYASHAGILWSLTPSNRGILLTSYVDKATTPFQKYSFRSAPASYTMMDNTWALHSWYYKQQLVTLRKPRAISCVNNLKSTNFLQTNIRQMQTCWSIHYKRIILCIFPS